MRALLSFLLCVVFLHAESCFATSSQIAANGGPNYGTLGSLVGTYSGVLIAISEIDSSTTETESVTTDANGNQNVNVTTTTVPPTSVTPNALGIFALGIRASGISDGIFLMFAAGQGFTGSIAGVADPNQSVFNGVLGATFTPTTNTLLTFSSTGTSITPFGGTPAATATGIMTAVIAAGVNGVTNTSTQLNGTSTLTVVGNITPPGDQFNSFGFFVGGTQQQTTLVNDSFILTVSGFQQGTAINLGTIPTIF